MSKLLWLLAPVIAGMAQPVIWAMNLRVARDSGAMEASMVLHLVGGLAGGALLAAGLAGKPGLGGLTAVPWWAFLAGAIGVSIMAGLNKAVPVVGLALSMSVLVAAQLGFSMLFEHFGWLGLPVHAATPGRMVGVALLVAGAWLVSR